MYKYVLKRLLALIPVILGVIMVIYIIMDFTPGDPARLVLGNMASQEAVEMFREERGLNDPFVTRYLKYVGDLLQGDLGTSYKTNRPVTKELFDRFPATLVLAFAGMVFALAISVPIGIISALKQNSLIDNVSMIVALLGIAMPAFWLGLLLILLFALRLVWLPSGGYGSIKHLVLPSVTVGSGCAANIARITRSTVLEIIRQDYIRTAKSKGINKRSVIVKHVMPNCWISIITVAGLQFGSLLGGTVIIENVFAWPGVGNLLITSINSKDTPTVLGSIVVFTIVFSIVNLITDVIYAYIDPRIKAQYLR